MLHFIYSADLSQLNGQNAIAVLYAAKKYNVIGLIRACLDFPIGQLQNVFFAFAETHFLGENSLLCDILSRDHLQISGEFVIWEAALRWADEKCRRNGTQCSAQNRCAMLGPALYKIRFPRFTEANFSTQIVHYCSQIWETVLRWADEKCRQNGTECSAQNPLYKIRFPRITEANFSTQIVHYCSQILETALRWADEKCRQNGTECSAQNRRAMLGPALYKIRFPCIFETDFLTKIVPSGLLTESEVSSILQWHRSRPKPTCRTVPSAPCRPLQFVAQFPTAKRNYQYRATLWQKIDNFAELARQIAGDSKRSFDSVEIRGVIGG
ncbi:hypothetical protein niasHS_006078 [Heterodera schachtii]|uniref:BACK domain-containing protein n=1 Tax=Heterodera schachtii TaxID=97005 RepID=A0ABD2JW32_HETSC